MTIRSRQGFEESNMHCPWCGYEHDLNTVKKVFERSGNKHAMMTVCDSCTMRITLHKHKLGNFTFYKYVDYKKIRMKKKGWQQQKFYSIIDYSTEFLKQDNGK
jgi:uncharacterized protein YlaI